VQLAINSFKMQHELVKLIVTASDALVKILLQLPLRIAEELI
jgi:hypothetical protein